MRAKDKFTVFDINNCGYIEDEGLTALAEWMMDAYVEGDEKVSRAGKVGMKEDMMAVMDLDKDGKLNLYEFSALFDKMEIVKRDKRNKLYQVLQQ